MRKIVRNVSVVANLGVKYYSVASRNVMNIERRPIRGRYLKAAVHSNVLVAAKHS